MHVEVFVDIMMQTHHLGIQK